MGHGVDAKLQLLIQLLFSSRLEDSAKLVGLGRELAFSLGVHPNPVGVGNSKTGVVGTYRPVGRSCPPCPISPFCYASQGPVGIHEARSSEELLPSLFSVAIALVVALRTGTPARLHVSGDLYRSGTLDLEYIQGLISIGRLLRRKLGHLTSFAWGYTQTRVEAFPAIFGALTEAHFVFLQSEAVQVGGTIIWPFDHMEELEAPHGVKLMKCPAQTVGLSCKECLLCPRAYELGLCIVFNPHGIKARALTNHKLGIKEVNGPLNNYEYAL